MCEFRTLKANEIECRIGTVNKYGISLLLYKDARCDMNILDETIGSLNWKREHKRDNANCVVYIWDETKAQWISKEDTGTESNTEAEKGLASDSFKRACFNWGIGRELYTAPFILIKGNADDLKKEKFYVSHIAYDDSRSICELIIKDKKGVVAYQMGNKKEQPKTKSREPKEKLQEPKDTNKDSLRNDVLSLGKQLGITAQKLAADFGLTKNTTAGRFKAVKDELEKMIKESLEA